MPKNDKSNDQTEDKVSREADAAAKAEAYAQEQKELAAKQKADAEADAAAKLKQAEQESVDGNLVKMRKGDEILAVHVSTVEAHKAAGWQVI